MKWRRLTIGVFLAMVAVLFMPRRTHQENSVAPLIADIRSIHTAEIEFFSRYGRYATLSELGQGGIDLLGRELAEGRSKAQTVRLRITGAGYTIQTAPIDHSRTRFRSFYSDQTLVIRESHGSELAS